MMNDMGDMMGGMGVMMLVGLLALLLVIAAGVYLALRVSGKTRAGESPRELLGRRLAAGEIDAEEYYEREAVLRSAPAPSRRRRSA